MISRSAAGRNAQLALRRQCCAQPTNRRGLAAAVSGTTSFSYETSDVSGVKVASRDVSGPTTKLAVIAKAGTRYQTLPGLTSGLEHFAFKVCINWQHLLSFSISNQRLTINFPFRTPTSVPHSESRENPSSLEVNCSHTTPVKLSSLRQSSYVTISHTSLSSSVRSFRKQSSPVSLSELLDGQIWTDRD
jgi:hypothetical protein